MGGVIVGLVKEPFADTVHEKALECVKSFREEAIKVRVHYSLPADSAPTTNEA